MSWASEFMLIGAVLMLGGILLGAFSSRAGIPFLLVFLIVGMLAGEDGPGKIAFDDIGLAYLVGNLALAIILLDGGLRTKFATFRVALAPSLCLASIGVVLTAAAVGALAAWTFTIDWRLGMLAGAVVGSTDAAAVFALMKLSGARLNERVTNTLEIESGVNDPMAIFLTIALIDLIQSPEGAPLSRLLTGLVAQFGIGAAVGLSLGWILGRGMHAARVAEGLQALLVSAGGVAIFALTNLLEGSGFLAVYLAGLVVGNGRPHVSESVMRAMDGFAWLAQSGMFLLLGLLATPHELVPVAAPALVLSLLLMFVVRPLVVWLTLLPFRFSIREVLFIGWVGLRGAVPIVLALFPLLAGIPGATLVFNTAFVVVLTSLLIQGTTVSYAARLFGVRLPPRAEPSNQMQLAHADTHAVEFVVHKDSPMLGADLATMELPAQAIVSAIVRGGQPIRLQEAGPLRANVREVDVPRRVHPGDGRRIRLRKPLVAEHVLHDRCEVRRLSLIHI